MGGIAVLHTGVKANNTNVGDEEISDNDDNDIVSAVILQKNVV